MTSNFDPNLDKRHLATQENRQVVTAYFKSNTSKGKDTMLPLFFVKDTVGAVTCEQGLCLGEKIARRGKGKGERCLFAFSSPQFPAWLKACSQTTGDVIWLDVFQPLCDWKSKLGQKAHRSLRISKNFLQLPLFLEDFVAQYLRRLDRRLINVFAENTQINEHYLGQNSMENKSVLHPVK